LIAALKVWQCLRVKMLKGIKNPQHEDQVAKEVSTKKQCDKSADYIDSSPLRCFLLLDYNVFEESSGLRGV
jgi:hypothetical protein